MHYWLLELWCLVKYNVAINCDVILLDALIELVNGFWDFLMLSNLFSSNFAQKSTLHKDAAKVCNRPIVLIYGITSIITFNSVLNSFLRTKSTHTAQIEPFVIFKVLEWSSSTQIRIKLDPDFNSSMNRVTRGPIFGIPDFSMDWTTTENGDWWSRVTQLPSSVNTWSLSNWISESVEHLLTN